MDIVISDNGKMLIVPVDKLRDEWKEQMSTLLGACFQNTPTTFSNNYYLLSFVDSQHKFLQSLFSISGNENVQTIWDVCSSAYGKSNGAIKELLKWYLTTKQEGLEKWKLKVSFYNSYWDQVINLYSSLGFIPIETENDTLIMEKINGAPGVSSKHSFIKAAYNERNKYFTSFSDYKVNTVLFPAKKLLDFSMQIVNRPREYSGIFILSPREDNEQELDTISNLTTGNLTFLDIYDYPTICGIDNYGLYHFHTHPKGLLSTIIIQPPSLSDIAALFNKFSQNQFVKHYVFTEDGIFSISFSIRSFNIFSPYPTKILEIQNQVIIEYNRIIINLTTLLSDPLRMLGGQTIQDVSVNPQKQSKLAIDYYIEECLKILHPGQNFSLFDVKFWSNTFLSKTEYVYDFSVLPKNFKELCPIDFKLNNISFPLTNKQIEILNQMDLSEEYKNEYCNSNDLIVPLNTREENIELWTYCNPYSFQNVGELFTLIGDNEQRFKDVLILLYKSVEFTRILELLQFGASAIRRELVSSKRDEDWNKYNIEYVKESFPVKTYREQTELKMLTTLSQKMSAYDVLRLEALGAGGFGLVSKGRSIRSPEVHVAIKEFTDGLASDAIREIGSYAILQATGSKYTPTPYGLSWVNGPRISFELFGPSLQSYRTNSLSKIPKIFPIIMDYTRAGLAEIHKCGLIHRDIKPDNILLKFDGTQCIKAVIADFGLTSSACPCRGGAEGYYAPEIMYGGYNTVKSDIWSLGMSLIDACFKESYFRNLRDLINRGLMPDLKFLFSSKRVKILENMVSVNPDNRHDLKIEMLPQPASSVRTAFEITSARVKKDVAVHAQDIISRYLDKTKKTVSQKIIDAAIAIAQKWVRTSITGPDDHNEQWKIILGLNGLIYLKK